MKEFRYKRFNRDGGTTEHTASGLTLSFKTGKPAMVDRKRVGKTAKDKRKGV